MVSFQVGDVQLREFEPGDAELVYEAVIRNLDHLKPFMHWITPDYSLESAKAFIEQNRLSRDERKSLGFGMFRTEKLIGSIGFTYFDWIAMKTEIGYWIDRTDEGKGIVTQACRLLVAFAFSELDMNRIEIRCAVSNLRSSAIPKRLGFTREGLLRQSEYRDGRLHDFEIYGLLRSEWQPDPLPY